MPYSKEHKAKSRERILLSATRLFPRLGYDAVSIDMLMEDAGLTRGAFYAHFRNKAEVYAESIHYAGEKSPFIQKKFSAETLTEWFEQTIGLYMSRDHIDSAPSPCPLAFLVTDINRRDETVRETYTQAYKALNHIIQKRVKEKRGRRDTVMALTAMMIGGVAVAHALNDSRTGDQLLGACREAAKRMLKITPSAQG